MDETEILRSIAEIDDDTTRDARRLVLEWLLSHDSHYIRDAAGLGLALMDDPRSISAVATAIANEDIPELQADLQLVLTQLENTKQKRRDGKMVTTDPPICAVCGRESSSVEELLPDANGNLLCWRHYKELYRPTSYPPMPRRDDSKANIEEWVVDGTKLV